jgi:hypothetical protein
MRYVGDWWGRIPLGVTVPLVPFTVGEVLFKVIPMYFQSLRRFTGFQKQIPGFVDKTPAWCREMRRRIQQIVDRSILAALWCEELKPYFCFGTTMAGAANSNIQARLQAQLRRLVGNDDANALLSNLGGKNYLSSLGPVVNLVHVAHGELSREDY